MQILAMNIERPELAILAVTPGAKLQALRLAEVMPCDCYTSDKLVTAGFIGFDGSMADCVRKLFASYQALLFICASGIAVRMIAPLVNDKLADPAILVMDERANHVISLLSGHVGGGNKLTLTIAKLLGVSPVITTATDVNQVAALDTLIQAVGADVSQYRQAVKEINQGLVSGQKIGLFLEHIRPEDIRGFVLVEDIASIPQGLDYLVIVSQSTALFVDADCPVVQVIPKNIVVGIGCRRDTEAELIYQTLCKHLAQYQIDMRAIKQIGSVIIKQDEVGLIRLSERLGVPFTVFPIEVLQEHEHRFPVSAFVRQTLGIGSVSQPSAWLMSDGHLLGETLKQDGMTITLGVSECYI